MMTWLALVLIIALVAATWVARKYLFTWMNTTDDITSGGFTLADLRQLHKAGKMTDEEFERAKAQLLAETKRPPNPASGGDQGIVR